MYNFDQVVNNRITIAYQVQTHQLLGTNKKIKLKIINNQVNEESFSL
jgi:hypothetical protein